MMRQWARKFTRWSIRGRWTIAFTSRRPLSMDLSASSSAASCTQYFSPMLNKTYLECRSRESRMKVRTSRKTYRLSNSFCMILTTQSYSTHFTTSWMFWQFSPRRPSWKDTSTDNGRYDQITKMKQQKTAGHLISGQEKQISPFLVEMQHRPRSLVLC